MKLHGYQRSRSLTDFRPDLPDSICMSPPVRVGRHIGFAWVIRLSVRHKIMSALYSPVKKVITLRDLQKVFSPFEN